MYILYLQTLETLLMTLHFLLIGLDYNVFYMLEEACVTVVPTLISYFFIKEVGKITESQTKNRLILIPLIGSNLIFCAGLLGSGIVLMVKGQYYSCQSWIWIFSSCSGILYGAVLLGFAMFLRREVEKWSIYSASRFNKSRFLNLWLFALTILLSYCVMLADSVYKIKVMTDCTDYSQSKSANIFLFIFIRIITHYSCIFASMYIFWPRQVEDMGLSLRDLEKIDSSSGSFT
jgi:MFS family permease